MTIPSLLYYIAMLATLASVIIAFIMSYLVVKAAARQDYSLAASTHELLELFSNVRTVMIAAVAIIFFIVKKGTKMDGMKRLAACSSICGRYGTLLIPALILILAADVICITKHYDIADFKQLRDKMRTLLISNSLVALVVAYIFS